MSELSARDVHRRLDHPVVDADGHFMEFMPIIDDQILSHLEQIGGTSLRERYLAQSSRSLDTAVFESDRRSPRVVEGWHAMPSWWGNPVADARERATAQLPGLLYERLEEIGVDLMLTYPSWTLGLLMNSDAELRGPMCRATNEYVARLFAPYSDRLISAALIPMETPEEAVAEIDHAVGDLGHKLVVLAGHAPRPIESSPESSAFRLDVFGIDSAFDYDPVWRACVRNGVAPVFHSSLQHNHPARSVSNYVFNHVGGIAHAHEALCKALFLGGVYSRFPELRFGYLEGGVAWGASLLADLLGHWEKRGGHRIEELDPAQLDVSAVTALVAEYGTPDMVSEMGRIEAHLSRRPGRPAELDDFKAAEVGEPREIIGAIANQSFFGCEADDPLTSLAFGLRLEGTEVDLHPMLGTDVSHWDAPVMTDVMPEAYDAVEDGSLTTEQFERFTFSNAVLLHGGMNGRFFDGTVCEKEAAEVLRSG